uniref:Small ribosomal subunit protein mS33 n=1 Tax=Amblyomma americanum TaxID=6943 RepID=A0A0C9SBY3_AMBAM
MSLISNYAKRMALLSARIFGEVSRPTNKKSMRVVQLFSDLPHDLNPEVVAWYPPHHQLTTLMFRLRMHGLYRGRASGLQRRNETSSQAARQGQTEKGRRKASHVGEEVTHLLTVSR